ncbi:hypothetical protein RJ55_07832 [Drechmeria coniospora]|nr:hypothetical protein RJ55_07832 [Drechmeria coniospora]
MRLSGLQKEVLALYRQCLRESRRKPEVGEIFLLSLLGSRFRTHSPTYRQSTRSHFEQFARSEFSKNMTIDKRDFAAVEFLLRKGRRQLDVYSSPGITDVR